MRAEGRECVLRTPVSQLAVCTEGNKPGDKKCWPKLFRYSLYACSWKRALPKQQPEFQALVSHSEFCCVFADRTVQGTLVSVSLPRAAEGKSGSVLRYWRA